MKRFLSMIITLILITISVCALPSTSLAASFSVVNSTSYAKTYMLASTGRTNVYTTSALKTRGTVTYGASSTSYIDNSSDEVYILEFGTKACKVSYPVGSKRVIAYVATSGITSNNGSHKVTNSTGKFYCSIRQNGAVSKSYYVDKGDRVELVATQGSRYQILYPVSGGKYRLAWCTKADYTKYCSSSQQVADDNNTVTKYLNGIPNYKQTDARWKNVMISTKTIGQVGCLITSMSMSESYRLGYAITPAQMRNRLKFSGNDMYWPSNYKQIATGSGSTALNAIYNTIKSGKPCIVGAKNSKGWHWVLIYGYKNAKQSALTPSMFLINDPASTTRTTLQQFLSVYGSNVTIKTYN